jgi:hypothetical protein
LDPLDGVPASVAVPLPLSVSESQEGNDVVVPMAGVGDPVVVTVKDPAVPWVKVAPLAEVMAGAVLTVSENDAVWVAPVPVPLTVTA